VGLTLLTGGLYLVLAEPGRVDVNQTRLLVLVVGGLSGLGIALATAALTVTWWDEVIAGGMEAWQGAGSWRLWALAYAGLVGLGLMFGSVFLARSEERSNVVLRRLLYGYNAALTGLLLLAVLALVNIVVYYAFPYSYDWSATRGIYALSQSTKNTLENLKEKTTVYVIMAQGNRVYRETRSLLDNCRAVTDKFEVRPLSPDLDRVEIEKLQRKYPVANEGRGLLLVYGPEAGPESERKPPTAFISQDRLVSEDMPNPHTAGERKEALSYKGEDVLLTELRFLAEGRQQSKVYMTQGNGELDINDGQGPFGAGLYKDRLEKNNFKVSGLRLRPPGARPQPGVVDAVDVPDDARVVIIARPQRPFTIEARDALRRYLKKNGKLIALFDPPRDPRDPAQGRTGLEDLLRDFNVQVGNDFLIRAFRVQGLPDDNLRVTIAVPPKNSRNPVAVSFAGTPFILGGARSVRPGTSPGEYQADTLLAVPDELGVWAETDLRALVDPEGYKAFLARRGQLNAKYSQEPVPVGVAVSEARGQKPRVVVIGNGTLATNLGAVQNEWRYYDLLDSCLEWLIERPANIGPKPKEIGRFALNPAAVDRSRLILLPGWLMLLGIVGLGTGIWVVRRR
jgi:hypothetical protein